MMVSKQDAASEQIDQAIRSFFAGLVASAVTLAGAAESSLPAPEDPDSSLFCVLKTEGAKRGLLEKDIIKLTNEVRDWPKHDKPHLSEIDLQEAHAVIMILRAYTKFTAAFGFGVVTPRMAEFEAWYREVAPP
jgi:hypothetical protein